MVDSVAEGLAGVVGEIVSDTLGVEDEMTVDRVVGVERVTLIWLVVGVALVAESNGVEMVERVDERTHFRLPALATELKRRVSRSERARYSAILVLVLSQTKRVNTEVKRVRQERAVRKEVCFLHFRQTSFFNYDLHPAGVNIGTSVIANSSLVGSNLGSLSISDRDLIVNARDQLG